MGEQGVDLGEARARERVLALGDEQVLRGAVQELALLDLEALLGELAEPRRGGDPALRAGLMAWWSRPAAGRAPRGTAGCGSRTGPGGSDRC
jgi:hypothetical protein